MAFIPTLNPWLEHSILFVPASGTFVEYVVNTLALSLSVAFALVVTSG